MYQKSDSPEDLLRAFQRFSLLEWSQLYMLLIILFIKQLFIAIKAEDLVEVLFMTAFTGICIYKYVRHLRMHRELRVRRLFLDHD